MPQTHYTRALYCVQTANPPLLPSDPYPLHPPNDLICCLQEFDLDDSGSICQEELTDAMAMFEGPNKDSAA